MSKKAKIAITVLVIVLFTITGIVSAFFIVKNMSEKEIIEKVYSEYTDDNIQENIDNPNVTKDDMVLQINGETILGVIQIDKIGYKGLVSEGTSLNTLKNYVGHFDNTPYFNGNVCLAAHNTNKFWAKLNTLENGDKISYISFLGTKEYVVTKVQEISETDWTSLEDTNENMLTLITCVKGKKEKRLCVQAIEQ